MTRSWVHGQEQSGQLSPNGPSSEIILNWYSIPGQINCSQDVSLQDVRDQGQNDSVPRVTARKRDPRDLITMFGEKACWRSETRQRKDIEKVTAAVVDLQLYCIIRGPYRSSEIPAAMSKREVSMFAAQGVDVDAPRAKRHRGPAAAPGSPAKEEVHSPNGVDVKAEGTDIALAKEDGEVVKEKGLKLWHVVKDAVNKECVIAVLILFAVCISVTAAVNPRTLTHFHLFVFNLFAKLISRFPQRQIPILRLSTTAFQTTIPRLLRADKASSVS